MRYIDIPGLAPEAARVRRVQAHGEYLAVLTGDGSRTHSVHWIRASDGAEVRRLAVPAFDCACDPALTADLSTIAYADFTEAGPSIFLERVGTGPEGRLTITPPNPYEGGRDPVPVGCLGFSTDGAALRASMSDGTLITWDVRGAFDGGAVTITEMVFEEYPQVRAMAPGRVPSGGGAEAYVIACDGAMTYLREAHSDPDPLDTDGRSTPTAAAFSPDGELFAVAFPDRVLVWGTANIGRPDQRAALVGHAGPVNALAFSTNSGTLATGGADGRVLFWSADWGAPRAGHDWGVGPIGGIAFSPDGCTCVAGGEGGRLVVWDLADEPAVPPPPASPPPPPPPPPKRTRRRAAPPPQEGPPPSVRWVPVPFMGEFPQDVAVAGHEADGTPLYAARARYLSHLLPGKVRHGFAGANVGYRGHEYPVSPFEVLTGQPVWRAASGGHIPADALPCGQGPKKLVYYLARAPIGAGLHPGKIARGMTAALIPFGGVEITAAEYEVLVTGEAPEEPRPRIAAEPLISWDFENVLSERGVSTSAGIPADPRLISGFVSQTGGGPAEVFGESGIVFLTRHLGSNDVFVWFTLTAPAVLEAVTFRHWHNHNPGYPTCPDYRVQLQLDEGQGYADVGEPLTLSNANSGGTDTVMLGRQLAPGSYRLRWHPRGLKRRSRDTASEFFAMKGLALLGRAQTE